LIEKNLKVILKERKNHIVLLEIPEMTEAQDIPEMIKE
jgi:hypothetical protein